VENSTEIFKQILESLAGQFDTVYYVDAETNHYFEYSSNDAYKSLSIPSEGDDFFAESRNNIPKYVYPEDQEKVINLLYKEEMISRLEQTKSTSIKYRLVVLDDVVNIRLTAIWANDRKHLIVFIANIDDEMRAKQKLYEAQERSKTYSQIAESLASRYDVIYYVDAVTDAFIEFSSTNLYRHLEIPEEGSDFFGESLKNIRRCVHPEDSARVISVLNKDYIITALEERKLFSVDYRLIVDGEPHYTKFIVMWSGDKTHFIIAVANIDAQIKKEKEHLAALKQANERALRDELTGVSNINAYRDLERAMQKDIDDGSIELFALVICDINDLKFRNDNYGHKAGDQYIKDACKMICDVFVHSPVFRIGGDEFVVVLTGHDYYDREYLLKSLRSRVIESKNDPDIPVIATGVAAFDSTSDTKVSDVFVRADKMMYEDKYSLKQGLF